MAYKNQHRGDEFYTLREDVERICSQYLDDLTKPGVRVLCPCDTDESQFVKFFLEHDVDVTWSNELRYQRFDFAEFDWVITNPPFSLMGDFLNRIADAGCGGLVIMPLASMANHGCQRLLRAGWHAYDEGVPDSFRRPDGSLRQFGWVVVMTHRADWAYKGAKQRQVGRRPPEPSAEGIPRYARVCDVPTKWEGLIAVPITFTCTRYDASIHHIIEARALHRLDGSEFFNSWLIEYIDDDRRHT